MIIDLQSYELDSIYPRKSALIFANNHIIRLKVCIFAHK